MFGVVFLHYVNADMGQGFKFVEEGSINQIILYFIQNICVCAVNLYVLISGYFLHNTQRRSFIKVIELIIQVIFFNEIFYLFSVTIGNIDFTLHQFVVSLVPANYYVILYVALYTISPYLNLIINNLSKNKFKKLMITIFIIFSCYTILLDVLNNIFGFNIVGLSTVSIAGSQAEYTIVNFAIMYFVGAYIRKNDMECSIKKVLLLLFANIVMLFSWSYSEHLFGAGSTTSWNYNNPLVITLAALVFLLFIKFDIKSKVVNELAKGSFVCFLVHMHFLTHTKIEFAVTNSWWIMLLHIVLVISAIYIISYIIYKVYSICTNWFFRLIAPIINRINISL